MCYLKNNKGVDIGMGGTRIETGRGEQGSPGSRCAQSLPARLVYNHHFQSGWHFRQQNSHQKLEACRNMVCNTSFCYLCAGKGGCIRYTLGKEAFV